MTQVSMSTPVNAAPDQVWRLIGGFDAMPDWHPLISGDPESVHAAGQSVRGWAVPEFEVPEEDWEDHIIEDP